jgi:hypothetical protein
VVLGEKSLDGILEGEIECLGREVTDNVGQVTTPERGETLFTGNADEAVTDTSVARDFTRLDLRVRVLSLEEELDTLDGGNDGLGEGTGGTTSSKIDEESSCAFTFLGGRDEGSGGCGGSGSRGHARTHKAREAGLLVETRREHCVF